MRLTLIKSRTNHPAGTVFNCEISRNWRTNRIGVGGTDTNNYRSVIYMALTPTELAEWFRFEQYRNILRIDDFKEAFPEIPDDFFSDSETNEINFD